MKRLVLLFATITACLVALAAPEGYAVYTPANTTLTFYYGNKPEAAFSLNSGNNTPEWYNFGTYAVATKVVFDPSFAQARPTSTAYWFSQMENLESITGLNYLNTSEVTTMYFMFHNCSKITALNLSNFNTSKVTNMTFMLYGCKNLTSIDVSSFNTTNVTSMDRMFSNCSKLTALDLSNFNTEKVTTTYGMFEKCFSLTSLNLSSFNTSNVTTMEYMFNGCYSLTSLDLSSFNTQKVTSMFSMFNSCKKLTSLDLGRFNTPSLRTMSHMFSGCSGLTNLDVSHFNTSNVTEMEKVFYDCSSLSSLDLSSFNTAKVMTMVAMFAGCLSLKTVTVSYLWTTEKVSGSSGMFGRCESIVGGAGTTFDDEHLDMEYAHIDGGPSNPGYLTEKSAAHYDLWVNNQPVTSVNYDNLGILSGVSGTVTYNPSTKTLTLDNATIVCDVRNGYGIKCLIDGLTIKLNGTNSLTADNGKGTYAMNVSGTTIKGPGTISTISNNTGIFIRDNKTLTIDNVSNLSVSSKYGIFTTDPEKYFRVVVKGSSTTLHVSGSSGAMGGLNGLVLNDGLKITQPVGGYFSNGSVYDASGNLATSVTISMGGGELRGDVNADGKVNVTDVTTLINMILEVIPKDEARADINDDGKINVSDVTALVNIILGVS